jgi:hypothetical protein
MTPQDIVRALVEAGYSVGTTKGGGQIKVRRPSGEAATQFSLSCGTADILHRLARARIDAEGESGKPLRFRRP